MPSVSGVNLDAAAANSAAKSAQPTMAEIEAFRASQKALQEQPYVMPQAGDPPGMFPVIPYPKDKRDDFMEAKAQFLTSAGPGGQPAATVPYYQMKDSDINYLVSKKAAEENFAFNEWAGRTFNLADPAQRRLLEEIVPQFFESREQLIEHVCRLACQRAKMVFRGIRTKADLELLWAIQENRIPFLLNDEFCPWNPKTWKAPTTQVGSGLFNPLMFATVADYPQIPGSALLSRTPTRGVGTFLPGADYPSGGLAAMTGLRETIPGSTIFPRVPPATTATGLPSAQGFPAFT